MIPGPGRSAGACQLDSEFQGQLRTTHPGSTCPASAGSGPQARRRRAPESAGFPNCSFPLMAITFRELSREELPPPLQHDAIQYIPKIDSIQITYYLDPIFSRADETNMDRLSSLEFDAYPDLEGSFRDQFPPSDGPYGHYPNDSAIPLRRAIDKNSIKLRCSKSFGNGSSITEIPSFIFEDGAAIYHQTIILKWEFVMDI